MKQLVVVFKMAFCLLLSFQLQAQHDHGSHKHEQQPAKPAAQPQTGVKDIFMVYGNCEMCEKRIERALTNVKGVHSADWNVETKVLTVHYDDGVISLEEIKKKVAAAGHDTGKFRASDEVYNSLPGCCQYERPKG